MNDERDMILFYLGAFLVFSPVAIGGLYAAYSMWGWAGVGIAAAMAVGVALMVVFGGH